MLQHDTLEDVVAKVSNLESKREDVLVQPEGMVVTQVDGHPRLFVRSDEVKDDYRITDRVHDHLAMKADIPRRHYDRLRDEFPDLYETEVNELLRSNDSPLMVRIVGREVRAINSNQYRRLDHNQLLRRILPVLDEEGIDYQRSSFRLDTRSGQMWLKVIMDQKADIAPGDPAAYGLFIRNGEFGGQSLDVRPGLIRFVCENGIISGDFPESLNRRHLGAPKQVEKRATRMGKTKDDNEDVWRQVQQWAEHMSDAEESGAFMHVLENMRDARERHIETSTRKMVSYLADERYLQEYEARETMDVLFDGTEDKTQFGLSQAVTRVAHEVVEDYERSTELERFGSRVVELDDDEWENTNQRAEALDEESDVLEVEVTQ